MISRRFAIVILTAICIVAAGSGCNSGDDTKEKGYYSGKSFKRPGSEGQATDKPVAESKRGGG